MGDVWFASLRVAISKGGREFAQKWRMIKQLKLAAKAKTAPTLKRDCLIDDRKKTKSLDNFKRWLRFCSKVEDDKTTQTEAKNCTAAQEGID